MLASKRLLLPITLLLIGLLAACRGGSAPYAETFDEPGTWSVGDDTYTEGKIEGGVYDLLIKGDDVRRWTHAGESFADGVYQVEATQVEGPVDNGFGMIFRADTDAGNFYLFKISGDGYVWIGRYRDNAEELAIVGNHWIQSTAVQQGLNATNVLRVQAESGNLIFFVNNQEVGRITDNAFSSGDIGLFAETLGSPGVRVHFDNFTVESIQ